MDCAYLAQYKQLYQHHWWWRAREAFLLGLLGELIPTPGRETILDVGCGPGLFFDELSRFGTIEGVESDPELVRQAGRWTSRIHQARFDGQFHAPRSYSLILMLDVLEHLERPELALANARELLSDQGLVVITVPAHRALWTTHDDLNAHRTRYSRSTLEPLVRGAGLNVLRSRYFFQALALAKLLVRLRERLLGSRPSLPTIPPPLVNEALYRFCRLEQRLPLVNRLPVGSSLLMVAGT